MSKFLVSSSPHIQGNNSSGKIMAEVILALLPAAIMGGIVFGAYTYLVILVSVAAAVLAEALWQKITGQRVSISDNSAAVTGLLLAMCMPPSIPLWMVAIGAVFAIIVVKQLFGGLGHNFMNPALAARAFMLASWPTAMTNWSTPKGGFAVLGNVDTVSSATVLSRFKDGILNTEAVKSFSDLTFITPGCIGETTALLLILGGIYLIARRIIRFEIPLAFLATVFIIGAISGDGVSALRGAFHVLNGGVLIAAFFMATDYVTSPMTGRGQLIMGIGCGLITMIIRLYGGYPEGVTYAILLMNILTPLIDKITFPRKYGATR